MIPAMILDAAAEHGWTAQTGGSFILLSRGRQTVHARYDRWRHITARAYRRGNALSAVFTRQRDIVEYLGGAA